MEKTKLYCTKIKHRIEGVYLTIKFYVKPVREYLLKKGFVYTLRKRRSVGLTKALDEFEPIAEVKISLVMSKPITNAQELLPFVENSGIFKESEGKLLSAMNWLRLAKKLSGDMLFLYRVDLLRS